MQERFSDRARHALGLANREATDLKHNFLAPAHLMLGLIAEGACMATEALRMLDVDLEDVRSDVRKHISDRLAPDDTFGRRSHTKEMKDVISLAINEARKYDHRYVGTEHIMLAMLQVQDGIPAKVLKARGVNVDTLREKTVGMLTAQQDEAHDLVHSGHGDFEWVHQQELAKAFRSSTFWHTMILAVDSANRLGASEMEPQHLLLALMRDETNGIAKLLGEKGVTTKWLRKQISS